MPGERPQSGAMATPHFSAFEASASSWRTTVLFPPRSAKWQRASMAGACQRQVQKIRNGGEAPSMAFHHFCGGAFARGVELDGLHLFVARNMIDARSDVFGALEITVGKRNGLHAELSRHVVGCGRAHHSGTDD